MWWQRFSNPTVRRLQEIEDLFGLSTFFGGNSFCLCRDKPWQRPIIPSASTVQETWKKRRLLKVSSNGSNNLKPMLKETQTWLHSSLAIGMPTRRTWASKQPARSLPYKWVNTVKCFWITSHLSSNILITMKRLPKGQQTLSPSGPCSEKHTTSKNVRLLFWTFHKSNTTSLSRIPSFTQRFSISLSRILLRPMLLSRRSTLALPAISSTSPSWTSPP